MLSHLPDRYSTVGLLFMATTQRYIWHCEILLIRIRSDLQNQNSGGFYKLQILLQTPSGPIKTLPLDVQCRLIFRFSFKQKQNWLTTYFQQNATLPGQLIYLQYKPNLAPVISTCSGLWKTVGTVSKCSSMSSYLWSTVHCRFHATWTVRWLFSYHFTVVFMCLFVV